MIFVFGEFFFANIFVLVFCQEFNIPVTLVVLLNKGGVGGGRGQSGCHNSSPRGYIVDRKFALGHKRCQLIYVYTSKDLPRLHFVYH